MKVILNVLGVIFILIGLVWILQGLNILPGSFMTGQIQYAVFGVILAAAGIGILIFTNRRQRITRGDDD